MSNFKQSLKTQRDVLESYIDTKADEYLNKDKFDVYFDGSGRFSQITQQFVNHYLSQKPEYDSRGFHKYEETQKPIKVDTINKYAQDYVFDPDKSQRSQIAQVLNITRNINDANEYNSLSKSHSVQDLNSRIRQTIDSNRKSTFI